MKKVKKKQKNTLYRKITEKNTACFLFLSFILLVQKPEQNNLFSKYKRTHFPTKCIFWKIRVDWGGIVSMNFKESPNLHLAVFFKVNLEKCQIPITRGAVMPVLSDIPRPEF